MKLSLFLVLNLLISLSAFARDEASDYITALKAGEVEGHILDSQMYDDCVAQADSNTSVAGDVQKYNAAIESCVSEKIKQLDDTQLEQVSSNMNISGLKFNKTKTNDSLRQYLSERIHDAIHGQGAYQNKKIKEMKFVDQRVFFTLYESQIHKNITLEFAKYCLENAGIKDRPNDFAMFRPSVKTEEINRRLAEGEKLTIKDVNIVDTYEVAVEESDKDNRGRIKYKRNDWSVTERGAPNTIYQKEITFTVSNQKFGNMFAEFNYCPKLNESDVNNPCYKTKARNPNLVKELKEFELHLSKIRGGTNLGAQLGARFVLCSKVIVPTACEAFRCRNTYTWPSQASEIDTSTIMGKKIQYCKDVLGINMFDEQPDAPKDKTGKIACNVVNKIVDYKKTLDLIKEQKKDLDDKFQVNKGYNVGIAFKGTYNSGQGDDEKSIDEITSIGSKDLVNNVDQFGANTQSAEDLRQRCLEGGSLNTTDAECQGLALSEEDIANLRKTRFQAQAETEAYLRRVQEFRASGANDPEALKTFLIENGLSEYATDDKISELGEEQLLTIIENKYKADRQAIIANMNDRLYEVLNKDKDKTDEINIDFANDQISDLEDNKDRVETLFNYTNIVTSYVQLSDGSSEARGNDTARNLEAQSYANAEDSERAQYEEFFEDNEGQSNSSDDTASFYSTESLINDIGDFASVDDP